MSERKIWKPEEDQILKELFEGRRITKWSQISKMMEELGVEGRNGKQCRERYHNHLKGGIRKEKWSPEEEARLVALHAEHGNRWALISKLIPGRTENCVKNMLYSKLRKSVRQLNRFSYEHFRKTLKEIKIGFIYRLIDFTENSYRTPAHQRTPQETIALRLKEQILLLDLEEGTPLDEATKEGIRQLVEDIHTFKRANQRFRGGHALRNVKRGKAKMTQNDEQAEGEDDEEEEELDEEQMDQQEVDEGADKQVGKEEQGKEEVKQACVSASTNQEIGKGALKVVQSGRGVKSKISIVRMDSLQSNLSFLMDAGLEKPIHTENQFINLTPTPRYTGVSENWAALSSAKWRNNFIFE